LVLTLASLVWLQKSEASRDWRTDLSLETCDQQIIANLLITLHSLRTGRRSKLGASMCDRWGTHQSVSSTHRNCAFWITQMDEYDHAYVAVSLCWLRRR